MNLIFDDISRHFKTAGINHFEKNDENLAWKKRFVKLFQSFQDKLDSDILGYLNSDFQYLVNSVDISRARYYLEKHLNKTLKKDREVKMEADAFLRDLIINGV